MKRGRFIRGRGGRHLISSLIHVSSTLRRTCLYSSLWYESLGLIACLIFCFIILHFSVVAPHHLQIVHRPHKALLREVCCIVSSSVQPRDMSNSEPMLISYAIRCLPCDTRSFVRYKSYCVYMRCISTKYK